MSFRFADPAWLALLVLAPLPLMMALRARFQRRAALRFSDLGVMRSVPLGFALKLRALLPALRALAIALLVLGFARPQAGEHEEELVSEGVDILLALDVSGSMSAEDLQRGKNRLEVVKRVVADFVQSRTQDRLGMVIFAGRAYLQCPLTLDSGVLLTLLDSVEIGSIEDGTAIGMAIVSCANRLRESPAKSKVVILLTDGVNNRGEIAPLTAAELAKAVGVKIYTIGAGTRGSALFPVDDPLLGRRYVRLPVEIDEEVLRQVARITGGRYFRATNKQALEQIYAEIGRLEKTEVEVKHYTRTTELFPLFLIGALALVGLEAGLGATRFRTLP
ncbi:MAG TPA: VWA domain-containing protein [Acidobacteriota bacterium]